MKWKRRGAHQYILCNKRGQTLVVMERHVRGWLVVTGVVSNRPLQTFRLLKEAKAWAQQWAGLKYGLDGIGYPL